MSDWNKPLDAAHRRREMDEAEEARRRGAAAVELARLHRESSGAAGPPSDEARDVKLADYTLGSATDYLPAELRDVYRDALRTVRAALASAEQRARTQGDAGEGMTREMMLNDVGYWSAEAAEAFADAARLWAEVGHLTWEVNSLRKQLCEVSESGVGQPPRLVCAACRERIVDDPSAWREGLLSYHGHCRPMALGASPEGRGSATPQETDHD
jgi:hypothetical protein